jgi:hypothetical protein
MSRKTIAIKIWLVWAAISFAGGCAQTQGPVEPIGLNQYSAEIARLEAVIFHNPGSSEAWQAHYQLARLYISYKNPRRNYKKALENLEVYLSHHPISTDDEDLQNWLAILNQLQDLSHSKKIQQLNAKLRDTRQANFALKEANGKLEKQNADLSRTIDMLKTLDHAVEEKRKNYSSE